MLVTRAAHQASALGDALTAHGLDIVSIPAIALAPPSDDYAALDALVERLDEFDWAVFTSANAVAVFADRAEEFGVPLSLQIASIGPATSRALRDRDLRVSLQPATAVGEALAAALKPHARGKRFLLVRAEQARDVVPEVLRAAGADITIAPAYRTVVPPESVHRLRREVDRIDAVTFTSSSAATNLFALLDESGVRLPPTAVLASIGPITSTTLRELGHKPHMEAKQATVESLALAVATALRKR